MASDSHASQSGADRLWTAIEPSQRSLGPLTRTIRERGRAASWSPPGPLCRAAVRRTARTVMRARVVQPRTCAAKKSCTSRTSRARPCYRPARGSRTLIPAEAEDWRDATRLLAMVLQDRRDLTGDAGGPARGGGPAAGGQGSPGRDRRRRGERRAGARRWHLTRRASLPLTRRSRSLRRPRRRLRPTAAVAASAPMPSASCSPPGSGRGGDADDAREGAQGVREAVALKRWPGTAGSWKPGTGTGSQRDSTGARLMRDPALLGSALAEIRAGPAAA